MNLTCIQYPISIGEIDKNKQVFLEQISLASTSDSIIVLPEMWFSGFDYKNLSEISKYTESICYEIQNELNSDSIIISSMPEDSEGKIYNSIFAISKDGVLAKYRKNMLFSPMKEDEYFEAGNDIEVFEFKGIKIGLHTCYEIRFPELFRLTGYEMPDVIAVPGIWPNNKIEHWLTLLRARAIENQCYIVACNTSLMHTHKKDMKCGLSVVYDSWGNEVALADEHQSVITTEIELEKIKEIRETIPSLKEAMRLFRIERKMK
jgi:predicted amidohydrolase